MAKEQYTNEALKLYALYGVWHLKGYANLPHRQAYETKNLLIVARIKRLNKVHMLWRPSINIKACLDAMRYNEERIKELN